MIFHQVFLSPQVKRKAIIGNKQNIHEFPQLRLRILGNEEGTGKSQDFVELQTSAQSSFQNKAFVDASKKLLKNRN